MFPWIFPETVTLRSLSSLHLRASSIWVTGSRPNNEISDALYQLQMAELYRTGAPFDWYLIDDLETIKDREYKVYVFLDCFYLTEQQRKTVESLRSDQRTLIWFYAPGYASQEDLSKQRMEELTGFRFEQNEKGLLQGMTASGQKMGLDKIQKTLFTVLRKTEWPVSRQVLAIWKEEPCSPVETMATGHPCSLRSRAFMPICCESCMSRAESMCTPIAETSSRPTTPG